MSKLAALKKNRGENLKKLQEKLEQQSGGGFVKDDRIWKPKYNEKKGKAQTAVVRFLTPKEGDPFVHVQSYQFKDKGGNYWDLARQTIGEKDPIQIAAINAFRKAKADNDASLREYAKKFMSKSAYYANVYIIKDEENPENEGQVKIFQFGRQIFQFIEKAINPEYDDKDPLDPFDYWDGADFKIRMVGKEIPDRNTGNKVIVPNYEDSEFSSASAFLNGDEDAIDEVYQKTFDLSEFVAPDKFKSFEEVCEAFKRVTGKPYNWLSSEGVEEHVQSLQDKEDLDKSVDHGDYHQEEDDDNSLEESKPQAEETSGSNDAPEGESAIERFKRLAKQSKK